MISNHSEQYIFSRARIYAILIPHNMTPGFAIPLVKTSEKSNSSYTPITSAQGVIEGFSPLIPQGKIVELKTALEVQVGQEEIFAVVDNVGRPSAGTKKEISKIIAEWVDDVKPYMCRYNFAFFCNDIVMACDVGKKIYREKVSELGNEQSAVRWFISAFICIPTIRTIISQHPQFDLFAEQYMAQPAAEVVIIPPSKAKIYLPRELLLKARTQRGHYRAELQNTLKIAHMCTGYSVSMDYRSEEATENSAEGARTDHLDKTILKISLASPQEKRVAMLISTYLKNPKESMNILDKYNDRSEYANKAVNILLSVANDLPTDGANVSLAVSKAIPRFVRTAYPQQRGRVILEFARELGSHPELSQAIKQIIYSSRQREVEEVSAEALECLKN